MKNDLKTLRGEIDKLDHELLKIIARRINVVKKIGIYKKTKGISLVDKERWNNILESQISKAKVFNVSENFIKKLYNLIHKHSLEIEGGVKNS